MNYLVWTGRIRWSLLVLLIILLLASTSFFTRSWASETQTWSLEVVDGGAGINTGEFADMTMDNEGRLHVSYYDATNGDLKYALQDSSGQWQIITLASEGDVGQYTSITLDTSGLPHIVYHDLTTGNLIYTYQTPGGWESEVVTNVDLGMWGWKLTSLALDADGNPHVAYHDSTQGSLKHAWKDINGWHTEIVDGGQNSRVGIYPSIVIGSDGYPRIACFDGSEGVGDLKYAYQDADGWHVEVVDSEDWVGWLVDLVLDSSGYPHISYHSSTTGMVRYAYQDANGWHKEELDSGFTDYSAALALDEAGTPYISYYGFADGWGSSLELKFAYKDASGWQIATVDEVSGASTTSLVLDNEGKPHIIYFNTDGTNGRLMHAYPGGGINESLPNLIVQTDRPIYRLGIDPVEISGVLTHGGVPLPDVIVALQVVESDSTLIVIHQLETGMDGRFGVTIPPEYIGSGTYTVMVQAAGINSTTQFVVTDTSVAAPVASISSGYYDSYLTVSLAAANPDAQIYYTLDASSPADAGNQQRQEYIGPLVVAPGAALALRAVAVVADIYSPVVNYNYEVLALPQSSLDSSTLTSPALVFLTTVNPGANMYYTLDNTDPRTSTSRKLYTGPVLVNQSLTLRAVTAKAGTYSQEMVRNYVTTTGTVQGQVTYQGQPVSGMQVVAGTINTTTNTNGIYTLANLAAGNQLITVPIQNGFSQLQASIDVAVGETVTRDLALLRGGTVIGRLRDELTGTGVYGIEVIISDPEKSGQSGYWASSTTDADGYFRLEDLQTSANYFLTTWNEQGYIDLGVETQIGPIAVESNKLTVFDAVTADQGLEPARILINNELERNMDKEEYRVAGISGTVRDDQGQPMGPLENVVAVIEYNATYNPNLPPDQQALPDWVRWDAARYGQVNPQNTDNMGRYGWDVPHGQYRVVFSKEGYETYVSETITVPPSRTDLNVGLFNLSSHEAPVPVQFSPASNASGVAINSKVTVSFSKAMAGYSLTPGFQLLDDSGDGSVDGSGPVVPGAVTYDAATKTATYVPDQDLSYDTVYTVKLLSDIITDTLGNYLPADYSWNFTTSSHVTLATIETSLSVYRMGSPVGIAGTLYINGLQAAGENVAINLRKPDGSEEMVDLGTNMDGGFYTSYIPEMTGAYTIAVSYEGTELGLTSFRVVEVAAPVASPAAGVYDSLDYITLSTVTGADIFYTLATNGQAPDDPVLGTSGTIQYNGVINGQTGTIIIKAIAAVRLNGVWISSDVVSFTYQVSLPENVVKIYPAELQVFSGQTFPVEIRVENAQDVYAADLQLYYDPAVVQVDMIDPNGTGSLKPHVWVNNDDQDPTNGEEPFGNVEGQAPAPIIQLGNSDDGQQEGYLRIAASRYLTTYPDNRNGYGGFYGDAPLAIVYFRAISPGNSYLELDAELRGNTGEADSEVYLIPANTFNGQVNVIESAGDSISGWVRLEGTPAPGPEEWHYNKAGTKVTAVQLDGNGDPLMEQTFITGEDGAFSFNALLEGTYDLRVSRGGYLSREIKGINVSSSQPVDLGKVLLYTGDVSRNNWVDLGDLQLMRKSYGTWEGMNNYNKIADLDWDNYVGLVDLLLLARNFAREGAGGPFVHQPSIAYDSLSGQFTMKGTPLGEIYYTVGTAAAPPADPDIHNPDQLYTPGSGITISAGKVIKAVNSESYWNGVSEVVTLSYEEIVNN